MQVSNFSAFKVHAAVLDSGGKRIMKMLVYCMLQCLFKYYTNILVKINLRINRRV